MNYKILVVDDEPDIITFISYNLEREGYEVYSAGGGLQAIDTALAVEPPSDPDGCDVAPNGWNRGAFATQDLSRLANTIIAFLTPGMRIISQIAGFEAGGDDYIAKPIRPKVLVSRIKALLKRFENQFLLPMRKKTWNQASSADRQRKVSGDQGRRLGTDPSAEESN